MPLKPAIPPNSKQQNQNNLQANRLFLHPDLLCHRHIPHTSEVSAVVISCSRGQNQRPQGGGLQTHKQRPPPCLPWIFVIPKLSKLFGLECHGVVELRAERENEGEPFTEQVGLTLLVLGAEEVEARLHFLAKKCRRPRRRGSLPPFQNPLGRRSVLQNIPPESQSVPDPKKNQGVPIQAKLTTKITKIICTGSPLFCLLTPPIRRSWWGAAAKE